MFVENINASFAGTAYGHNTGAQVTDPQTYNGNAWLTTQATGTINNLMTWGQYYSGIDTGGGAHGVILWRAKVNTVQGHLPVFSGTLAYNLGQQVGEILTTVYTDSFAKPMQYQFVSVPWQIPVGASACELYTVYLGNADIYLDTALLIVNYPKQVSTFGIKFMNNGDVLMGGA